MKLTESTWKQVESYLTTQSIALLPVGSTEQHGFRGVFGVDHYIPAAILEAVAEKSKLLVLPTVAYGMSLHHMAFPGTMSLRPSTFQLVIIDIITSCYRAGLKRLYILNGHGGNIGSIEAAISEILDRFDDMEIKSESWWKLPTPKKIVDETFGDSEGDHATPGELSMMMAIKEGLLTMAPVDVTCLKAPQIEISASTFRRYFPTGAVRSNSNLANADIGKKLLEACEADVMKELSAW